MVVTTRPSQARARPWAAVGGTSAADPSSTTAAAASRMAAARTQAERPTDQGEHDRRAADDQADDGRVGPVDGGQHAQVGPDQAAGGQGGDQPELAG
jgi:hypothetical protein